MKDQNDMRMPRAGEGWRHYKGGHASLYEIVGVGINVVDGNAVVIYRPYGWTLVQKPPLFTRPLDEFLGFTEGKKQRFTIEREPANA